jgi:hypothetical protein
MTNPIIVIFSIIYLLAESLWAGYLLKVLLKLIGYEVPFAWTYAICFVVLNVLILVIDIKFHPVFRLNAFLWIFTISVFFKIAGLI